jgi:hypothetical protein
MVASIASSSPSALVTDLTDRVGAWLHVTLAPHPGRAVAFRLDEAPIGVVHHDGLIEVPLPGPIRRVLVDHGCVVPHAAQSGAEWGVAHLHTEDDVASATLLLRLSYLYRRLLRSQTPATLRRIRVELSQYSLPDALDSIYASMLAKRESYGPTSVWTQPVTPAEDRS